MKANNRTRNLRLFIVLILLGMGGGAFFLLKNAPQRNDKDETKEESYFVPFKILGYDQTNMPYLDITIEDKTFPMKIDLGFNGMLSLNSNLIKDIDEKKWMEQIQSYGLRGRIYEEDVYEVERIWIQDVSFFPINLDEESLERKREGILAGTYDPSENLYGKIGFKLFEKFNLLVDCKHSTLALCNSLETLNKQGYPVDSFIEAKLLTDSELIAFEAITEAGPLRCVLDTGCTFNMLNNDLEGSNDHQIINPFENLPLLNPDNKDLLVFDAKDTKEFSSFKIGEKEFGPLTFYQIKSPFAFDAILGMEFFDSHLVFIDFEKEKVYFFPL